MELQIIQGTDGVNTFDKYKIAAVDGGILNIDTNMSKSDTVNYLQIFFL